MFAASRFAGGPLVQIGFGLCFVAFGGALAVVLVALQAEPARHRSPATAVLALATVGMLWLPAYEGVAKRSGQLVVESGWSGLDPVSLVAIAAMVLVIVWPRTRADVALGAAASVAGLLVGNWLIQAFTARPTNVRFGLGVGAIVAVATAFVAAATLAPRVREGD